MILHFLTDSFRLVCLSDDSYLAVFLSLTSHQCPFTLRMLKHHLSNITLDMEQSPRTSTEKLISEEDLETESWHSDINLSGSRKSNQIQRPHRRLWISVLLLLFISLSLNIFLATVSYRVFSGNSAVPMRWDEFTLPCMCLHRPSINPLEQ